MLPEAFVNRMRRLLGEEYDAFDASYARPRNVGLRFNPLKCGTFPSLPFLRDPVAWEKNGFTYDPDARPGLHAYHDAGVYYLQEPSAMSAAALLDAQPGERVLDLCAAPGGKSTQLAGQMRSQGLLVCNEIVPGRAKILSRNIERLGITNALVLNEHPAHLAQVFPCFFDRILVDAPCSGEGMFRKEEAAVTDWSKATVKMCAGRQAEILSSAAQMLRGGGRLVYSTCTFSPEENEGVISAFLHSHPEFSVEIVDAPFFSPGRPDWIEDPAEGVEHTFRLWPHKLKGEGHFAAVLRKNTGAQEDAPVLAGEKAPAELLDFIKENALSLPQGKLLSFGQSLFLAPDSLPSLRALKVLRPGLQLGTRQKGRFEPDHALALALRDAENALHLPAESDELARYLRGETIPCELSGWTLVCADEYSLGWGKCSGGVLKNHYPKGLRRV